MGEKLLNNSFVKHFCKQANARWFLLPPALAVVTELISYAVVLGSNPPLIIVFNFNTLHVILLFVGGAKIFHKKYETFLLLFSRNNETKTMNSCDSLKNLQIKWVPILET